MKMGSIVENTNNLEGKVAEVLSEFNDLRIVKSGEWVNNLILPGDLIKIIEISISCDIRYPACCPSRVYFSAIDMPELGTLEGEMYRPDQKLKTIE
jgi:hypothetical protein